MQINSSSHMVSVMQANQASQRNTQQPNNQITTVPDNKAEEVKATNEVTTPALPNNGEKLETYAQIKKTQMQYQVASDMMNIASGDNSSMSLATAAYLSNNEDAREVALQHKTMQQQYQNVQTYQDQTENYQNSWVV